jgi:hypothetical protein
MLMFTGDVTVAAPAVGAEQSAPTAVTASAQRILRIDSSLQAES